MATITHKPSTTIGVDKYTIFPVTEVDGVTTYGEAVHLPGTVEIAPSDQGGAEAFDADNGAYEVETYIESIGHEITQADIPPEVEALMRGKTLNNGVLEIDANVSSPYFACAWRILKADGSYRYVRYYKGKYSLASNVGGTTKPSSGASEKQTATATFTAVKREDNLYYGYIDERNIPENAKATFESKWFSDPTYYPSAGA